MKKITKNELKAIWGGAPVAIGGGSGGGGPPTLSQTVLVGPGAPKDNLDAIAPLTFMYRIISRV